MGSMFASLLILLLPVVFAGLISLWLWRCGILGRFLLVGIFMCGAVEAHSIIYPQKQLKENYARVIG
jgi:hypothetical protein